MLCQICKRECKNYISLSSHLRQFHNLDSGGQKEYYDKWFLTFQFEKECKTCRKETRFLGLKVGYGDYCSKKCSANSKTTLEKRKSTNRKKYGTDFAQSSDVVKDKVKQTNLDRYGVENLFQSKEIKDKIKQTNLERYGVEHTFQSDKIKEKIKQTNLDRYGHESHNSSDIIKEKKKHIFQDRYGVKNPSQSEIIKYKTKQTNLERYGVEHTLQSKEIRKKIKQTCLERYGGNSPYSSEEVKKRGINNFLKNHILNRLKNIKNSIPLFNISRFNGVGYYDKKFKWQCLGCKNIFYDYLYAGHNPRCPDCFPFLNTGTSKLEKELQNWLNSKIKIKRNKRFYYDGIKFYELDIFIPSHNIGIEFNGLYWHSELAGKDKNYHLNKTTFFEKQDIQIIHVFENEWILKQDIVKSIILNRLCLCEDRIYARKCKIDKIDSKTYRNFLDDNHIQGACNSKEKLGLFYNDDLVSVMGFGKSRFKKGEYELIRYSNKLNTSIVGGFSKILKHFLKLNNVPINSYCDRRYFNGNGYKTVGFEIIENTSPNYFYFKDDIQLYNRIQFQKHKLKDKLEKFDVELTEWENMQMNGWNRIFDCGNIKLVYI